MSVVEFGRWKVEGAFEGGRESGLRLCDGGGDGTDGAQCVMLCRGVCRDEGERVSSRAGVVGRVNSERRRVCRRVVNVWM